ncbi:MAG: AI-2E family transporter [Pseudomonadota bacterium]
MPNEIHLADKKKIFQLTAMLVGGSLIFLGCLAVIMPFIPAILLGLILALATWPAFVWVNIRNKGRTGLSAAIMTLMLVMLFVLPVGLLSSSLVESSRAGIDFITATLANDAPATAPSWVANVPMIGQHLSELWSEYAVDRERMLTFLQENAGKITDYLLIMAAAIGRGLFDITLGIVICYFMLRHGTVVAQRLHTLIGHTVGRGGYKLLEVSKGTLIGVIYGVVGTAILQGVVAAIGFMIAGIPGAVLLGVLTLFLSFIPGGPPLVWIPAALWLLSSGHPEMALFLGIWGIIAISSLDNVARVYLISRGTTLPLILILLGVFGGLMAFGFIGLFVGPTLLAMAYTLLLEWSHRGNDDPAPESTILPISPTV